MENPIKQIVKFNRQAGLLDKGYDDFLESSFQIEEALEGFEHLPHLASKLDINPRQDKLPKHISREIVSLAQKGIPQPTGYNVWNDVSDLDRLDKACDSIVFAVGSMAKLGLDANQITKALNIVMKANMAKLDMPKDAHGKLMKPEGFVGPEVELQKLLDER